MPILCFLLIIWFIFHVCDIVSLRSPWYFHKEFHLSVTKKRMYKISPWGRLQNIIKTTRKNSTHTAVYVSKISHNEIHLALPISLILAKVALVSLRVLTQAILGFYLTLVRSTLRQWYEDYYGASLLNDVEGSATFVFTITWLSCPWYTSQSHTPLGVLS